MAYGKLNAEDVVLGTELVSTPIWSNHEATMSSGQFKTSSQQTAGLSAKYYLDVYNTGSDGEPDEVQFAIAYGNKFGSGSTNYNTDIDGYSPSRTVYGQFRSLVLGDEESEFYMNGSDNPTNYFYAITIDRARYKEKLQPGSLRLAFSNGTTLVEDVSEVNRFIDSGRVISIKKDGDSSTDRYGWFLPDIGTLLLDGEMLRSASILDPDSSSLLVGSGSESNYNAGVVPGILLNAISSFSVAAEETISSNYVFVRAKNAEYNYSVNPTNITANGELRFDTMINSPAAYITTVGLYNDNNDLLAVAKLSRPLLKNFTKECLIRVKLDY